MGTLSMILSGLGLLKGLAGGGKGGAAPMMQQDDEDVNGVNDIGMMGKVGKGVGTIGDIINGLSMLNNIGSRPMSPYKINWMGGR